MKTGKMAKALIIVLSSAAFAFSSLEAQELYGKWQEKNYNIQMTLNRDGTYLWQHASGSSVGRFDVQGQYLRVQDQAAYQPIVYLVIEFQADRLVLQDAQGIRMNFDREVTPQQKQANTSSSASPVHARVLARSGSHEMTAEDVETGIGLVQFIIGQAVKQSERRELSDRLILEFKQDPANISGQLKSIAASLKKLHAITDPVHIGIARQELFSALHFAAERIPEQQKPLIIQVINRYIRVLAADQGNRLLLTDRDARGMVSYLAFLSDLNGQPMKINAALEKQIIGDVIAAFPSLSGEQKKLLCSAGLLWQLMEYNWNRLNPSQKQQFRSRFAANHPTAGAGQAPVHSSGQPQQRKSAAAQMADYQARRNCMRMMRNMNTNSHVLSLNIIENIGGTGNYWKAVDY